MEKNIYENLATSVCKPHILPSFSSTSRMYLTNVFLCVYPNISTIPETQAGKGYSPFRHTVHPEGRRCTAAPA